MRHRRAEDQGDDDGERKDRLDEHDGRQRQGGGLAGVAEHVGEEAEEPSGPADQPGHETDAQRVLVGNLLRFGQLEHVAERVQEGRQESQDDCERDFQRHGATVWGPVRGAVEVSPRRLDRRSFVQVTPRLRRWRPQEPGVAQLLDLEPRLAHQPVDGSIEVAPGCEPLLKTVQTVLPARRRRLRAQAVLEEMESPAGSQHATQLAQGSRDVRDRAQRERAERGIDRLAGEWEVLPVEADEPDRYP